MYLKVSESDRARSIEMAENIGKEYIKRARKLLKSKLDGPNLFEAVNTWAVL